MPSTEHIYRTLKKRLEEYHYPAESKFPSEYILAKEFDISKVTANKIVSRLVEQGYLKRGVRGSGTRVLKRLFRPLGHIAFIGKLNAYTVEILRGVQQECLRQHVFPAHEHQALRRGKIAGHQVQGGGFARAVPT